jgi:hypothetical protein
MSSIEDKCMKWRYRVLFPADNKCILIYASFASRSFPSAVIYQSRRAGTDELCMIKKGWKHKECQQHLAKQHIDVDILWKKICRRILLESTIRHVQELSQLVTIVDSVGAI